MININNLTNKYINFQANKLEDVSNNETHILPNTIGTRTRQATQKTMSAFIDYPVKGLKGDVNSNFYEFLTMGIVPYIAGSAMFMVVFNALNIGKHLGARDAKAAGVMGKKMALGVIFYGLLKNLSKHFVTEPIKLATGVDTEMPYQNKVYNLPKEAGEDAEINIQWQQRKIFDSKEFFRKDLLDRTFYDKVAKKLGLGENLNDSISETTPIIQNIIATSNTAKSLSSYCWAAVGVALAAQNSWVEFFNSISNRNKYQPAKDSGFATKLGSKIKNISKNSLTISKTFINSFGKSCKELWQGNPNDSGFMKHSGKALIGISVLTTIGLTANSIIRARYLANVSNKKTIDNSKASMVI